ncbi:MAG TPA: hypothetical protein VLE97_11145 [Gaiellaceae bacterium]|nr:hypothetical protein [Gaiellaceae bacterium]
MTAPAITRRQREVLDHLSEKAAFSRETASMVYGADSNVADTLAQRGMINKRYDRERGAIYWIRADGELETTASVPAGFVVILSRNVTTPSGRTENFFLARARYDGKGTTFRKLLRGWMSTLNLKTKDLLGGAWGFELIATDEPVFSGDHVIVDETTTAP